MMNDKIWFLLQEGQVTGPYSGSDIEAQAPQLKNPLVWGRGQSEWLPLEKWTKWLKETEAGLSKTKNSERIWKVRVANQEAGPMDHEQMIEYLKKQTDYDQTQIWTEGYGEWKDIFQIHKIMDELGVSRRQHPRVPIMGTLQCEGTTNTFAAKVLSISEGGFGITDAVDIKIGEKLKTTLKSPNLAAPIHSTCEVVYLGNDGYAGLKFISIQAEASALVIEYVKKFT